MPRQVVQGALLRCNKGTAPAALNVVPKGVVASATPAAVVTDIAPMANVPPFGLCNSKQNPQVIALTSANQGVHTPAPCQPVIVGPWKPGALRVKVRGIAALTDKSKCQCAWGGSVEVTMPGAAGMKISEK